MARGATGNYVTYRTICTNSCENRGLAQGQ